LFGPFIEQTWILVSNIRPKLVQSRAWGDSLCLSIQHSKDFNVPIGNRHICSVLTYHRFPSAVNDFRSSLSYKNELYPEESEIIAEAHFKLSLALEFASITKANDDKQEGEDGEGDTHIDQGLRDEAVKELEAAIKSSKLKLENKEIELATMHNPDENEVTRAQIADVKEMVAEMENRVSFLSLDRYQYEGG